MRIVSLDEVPAYKNIVEIGQRVSARACVSREQPKSVEWIEVTTLEQAWLRPNVEQSRPIRACCVTARVGDVLRIEDESDVRALIGCEVTWSDRNESGTVSGTVRLLGDVRVRLAEGSQTLCLPVTVRVAKTAEQSSCVRAATIVTRAAEPYDIHPDEMSKTEQQAHGRSFRGGQTQDCVAACSTCMGARVLRHIIPGMIDEPCPDCPPEVTKGLSEWTLTESVLNRRDDVCEAWHYTFTCEGRRPAWFRVVAHIDQPKTVACRFTHYDEHGHPIFGRGIPSVTLSGERCVEMVRDRLLCGLRDKTVTP
jgi:hypothetical protein